MEEENQKVSKEKIRERRKLERDLKKLEKKQKREEEFLKNLRKPKYSRVLLADKNFFEQYLKGVSASSSQKHSYDLTPQDFPALSCSFPTLSQSLPPRKVQSQSNKQSVSYKKALECSVNVISSNFFPPIENKSEKKIPTIIQEKENDFAAENTVPQEKKCVPRATSVVNDEIKPRAGPTTQGGPKLMGTKKVKKKTPIVLSVDELIVDKSSKKNKNNAVYGSKYRRMTAPQLSGNMLDASNPKRSKGKHREVKKIRLSKLKLAIIENRIMKAKARINEMKKEEMDSQILKVEVVQYLNSLKKEEQKNLDRGRKTKEEAVSQLGGKLKAQKTEHRKKNRTKYREYCDNKYFEALDTAVKDFVSGITFLQDRAFKKDPIKAKAKERYVVGLREVKKYLILMKIKMVILAPDLEANDAIFNEIKTLKKLTELQKIPCVFALNRRFMGMLSKKPVPVSAFGVLNFEGLEEKFSLVVEHLKEAKQMLKESCHKVDVSADKENTPSSPKKKENTDSGVVDNSAIALNVKINRKR